MCNGKNQSSYWKYIGALLSILGIVLTASIGYYFNKKVQRQDSITNEQIKAYIDFIDGNVRTKKLRIVEKDVLKNIGALGKGNNIAEQPDFRIFQRDLIDLRIKIAESEALEDSGRFRFIIYGSLSSLKKMANYLIYKYDSDEMHRIMSAELFESMRSDLYSDEKKEDHIKKILFPNRYPSTEVEFVESWIRYFKGNDINAMAYISHQPFYFINGLVADRNNILMKYLELIGEKLELISEKELNQDTIKYNEKPFALAEIRNNNYDKLNNLHKAISELETTEIKDINSYMKITLNKKINILLIFGNIDGDKKLVGLVMETAETNP